MRLRNFLSVVLTACSLPVSAQTYTGRLGAGSLPDPPGKASGTVIVAVALSDGLVLAADSRLILTYQGVPGYKIVSDSAPKLFSVGKIAIGTYGEAFLLGRSIASYVSEFEASKTNQQMDIDETAKAFTAFFDSYYVKQPGSLLGFIFAGYDKAGVGKVFTVEFPSAKIPSLEHDTNSKKGALWRGQIEVINRLLRGIDPGLATNLQAIVSTLPEPQKGQIEKIPQVDYYVPFEYLMLQDGIDFALTLVQTTVNMQRFSYGTIGQIGAIPGVGGTVDVVAVTPLSLTWVRKKTLAVN